MSATALTSKRPRPERSGALSTHELGRSRATRRGDSSGGGRLTLEQLLDGVWEGLHADGAAECPVCRGRMSVAESGGLCGDCGSTLS
jgi:hypothetical protein